MKTALLLIAALLVASVLCAAACVEQCSQPSCHHEKNSPAVCSHELILHRSAAQILPAEIAPPRNETVVPRLEWRESSAVVVTEIAAPVSPPLRI